MKDGVFVRNLWKWNLMLCAGYFKDSLANCRDHVDCGFCERVWECPAEVSTVVVQFWELYSLLQFFSISVGEVDMIWYIYTCNFWRTLHELQEYIEKIFPLCSRQWPIINIYSNVGFVGCATWWTLYNKVSCLYRPGVQDSVNLYVEKQDRTKLTGPS